MSAPTIEWIRPGVGFTPDAAAAFRRAEADVGRQIDVNSTYRSWDTQLAMHEASLAYLAGRGPYPGHSYAAHPKYSRHVGGTALDSDDWRDTRVRAILADHGFIRNQLHVKNEEHHFEYLSERDNHRNEGTPAGGDEKPLPTPDQSEEDDMANPRQIHYVEPNGRVMRALLVPGTGYFVKWTEGGAATIANRLATNMETNSSSEVTKSVFDVFEREAAAQRPKDALSIELAEA